MVRTLKQAQDAYLENADYEQAGSVLKAQSFITACRELMLLQHSEASKGGSAGTMQKIDVAQIKDEQAQARQWLQSNDPAVSDPSYVSPDFSDFRDGRADY